MLYLSKLFIILNLIIFDGDEMKIVVTIGGSIIIKDHDYRKFRDYADVLRNLKEENDVFVVVGGGKTAREYIDIARSLGVSEAMCDDVGIEVTRLNAKLLIAALGEDALVVDQKDELAIALVGRGAGALQDHGADAVLQAHRVDNFSVAEE